MAFKDEYKQALWIAGFGAVGGILSCVYAAAVAAPIEPLFSKCLASVVLGAGASFIGAYLLANPNMGEAGGSVRAFAFAVICGFAWRPVYDAGTALVDKAAKDRTDSAILSDVKASEAQAPELAGVSAKELPTKIAETKTSALALIADAERAQKPETKRRARMAAEKLIKSLAGPTAGNSPEAEDARLDALKEVGGKAALTKDMDLYQMAVGPMRFHRNWSDRKRPAADSAARELAELVTPPAMTDAPAPNPPTR
jgi:hypothetical protein